MSKPKIYIKDRIYIPVNCIDKEELKDKYTHLQFNEQNCRKCEYRPERFGPTCETCANYLGKINLFQMKTIKGKPYIGLPLGDKKNVEKHAAILYSDFKIVDLRKRIPFDYKINFVLPLYDYQKPVVKDFLKSKYGLIEAPPRVGKTAMALYIAVELGYRMVFIADQIEFLDQFIWHIEGNEEEGIPKFTNLPELQKKYKKKLYGFPKTEEDFKTMQIMCVTYQSLINEGKGAKRLKWLTENVGTVGVDEVHSASAPVFSTLLNKQEAAIRFGVTGTVERKDGKHKLLKKILGPIVATTDIEALTPKVFIKNTNIKYPRPPKHWTFAMLRLAKNEKRNRMIVKQILVDVRKGHSVVVPCIFKNHIQELVRLTNQEAGKKIAVAFTGGGGDKNKRDRKALLRDVKLGKYKVVFGIRRLIQRGLNVKPWSAIHEIMPISNKPNLKQETKRVCTPMEGKRTPIVRLWFDEDLGQSIGCAKSTVRHLQELKYIFSTDEKTQVALDLLSSSKRRSQGDEDEDAGMFKVSKWMD
jgi:hypothetical protein